MSDEVLVTDVTTQILGEQREEWRAGYDAGLRAGARRVIESQALEQIVIELVLLREVAQKLGAKADYWIARAQEMEITAEYWHGVSASAGEALAA